ncbi:hypothetical protein Hanom_Chr17g01582221 [Helianthus anomalus]
MEEVITEEVCAEISFDETLEVSEDYYDSKSHEILQNVFKSIMPPDMFNSCV